MSEHEHEWTNNGAGPIQVKRIDKAIRDFWWRAKSVRTIYDSGESLTTLLCGGTVCEGAAEMAAEIGRHFDWTITRQNAKDVQEMWEINAKALVLPIEDRRTTAEERDERAKAEAERRAEDNAKSSAADANHAAILAKRPAWAEALIVAEQDENDSDLMSDYHNHKTTRHVAIGWRRGKREDFHQLREAAAAFPETAHLGPDRDDYTVRTFVDQGSDMLRSDGGQYEHFETSADAKAAGELAVAMGDATAYELRKESVEHRENYSMGAGNYLKAGGRDSSGWCVKSYGLPGSFGWTVFEDHLPVAGTASTGALDVQIVTGGEHGTLKAHIEKHFHAKRQINFWLVVPGARLSDEQFAAARRYCEAAGGWYNRKFGRCPGGFAFRYEETASVFAAQQFGKGASAAATNETVDPMGVDAAYEDQCAAMCGQ